MKKIIWVLGTGWLLSISPFSLAQDNACITCHQQLTTPQYLGHDFADWQQSVHARVGVTCVACHGGNTKSADPVKAHRGVLSSRDENSSVHFQKIPATCGQCHQPEFGEFQKSIHYKTLLRTGKGPNCLTCHGAMATTILAYSDLEKTCSLCHGKPVQAAKALSLIHALKTSLQLFQKQLTLGKEEVRKPFLEREKEFLERYAAIQRKWHSFNVGAVIEESQGLVKDLKEAENALKGKKR